MASELKKTITQIEEGNKGIIPRYVCIKTWHLKK